MILLHSCDENHESVLCFLMEHIEMIDNISLFDKNQILFV